MDRHGLSMQEDTWTTGLTGAVNVCFDLPSNILYLDASPMKSEYEFGHVGDTAIIRWDRTTGTVERVMILDASAHRSTDPEILALPLDGELRRLLDQLLTFLHANEESQRTRIDRWAPGNE